MITKSSIMLGLGESDDEVKETTMDIPKSVFAVKEYVSLTNLLSGKNMGSLSVFCYVASGPLFGSLGKFSHQVFDIVAEDC
ncbi:lipoate synthase, putative [Medicago truncatula]|uniref:Lipoate synthase, putative n=1 Tax=Medicago truncatula TaxID=3880 RepID=A0A072VKC7_MEDTR|nr:lipoate synthase, putative [Medicago truncatula]